jgi:tetratricopeptide (TPR) repeat protein
MPWYADPGLASRNLILDGYEFARTGNISEALQCFLGAAELDPKNAKAWYNCGLTLLRLGEYYDLALWCFDRTLNLNPRHAEAWNYKGKILSNTGKALDGLMCYQEAIAIMPTNVSAWQNLGELYREFGNNQAARVCLKKAKRIGRKNLSMGRLGSILHLPIMLIRFFNHKHAWLPRPND